MEKYEKVRVYANGDIEVEKDGKYGVISNGEKVILPIVYDEIQVLLDRIFIVKKDGSYEIIDKINNKIRRCDYDYVEVDSKHKLALIEKNGKLGLLGSNGKTKLECVYDEIGDYNKSIVKDKNYKGFLYHSRKEISVYQKNKRGIVDFNGNVLKQCDIYEKIFVYANGDMHVRRNDGKEGIVSKDNKIIIPFMYHWKTRKIVGWHFKYKVVRICENGKYGIVNAKGEEIIPIEYDEVQVITDKLFIVRRDKVYEVIDKLNNTTKILDYDYVEADGELALVKKNGKVGLLRNGKEILDCVYDQIGDYNGSFGKDYRGFLGPRYKEIPIYKNGKRGTIDYNGNILESCDD